MGDRRIGDRREAEEGIIKVQFKDAVVYLIISVVIIISVSANIVLAIRNMHYKEELALYEENYIDESYLDESDIEDSYIDDEDLDANANADSDENIDKELDENNNSTVE